MIAVPVIGFLILVVMIATCCFFFFRYKRKKAHRSRQAANPYNHWNGALPTSVQQQQAWAEQQMYNPGGYGQGAGFGFVDNDGRGQELAYGHGQDQQYQQHFQGHDKPGFSQEIIEESAQQPQQELAQGPGHTHTFEQNQKGQHPEAPAHPQVLEPDRKDPQQWQ